MTNWAPILWIPSKTLLTISWIKLPIFLIVFQYPSSSLEGSFICQVLGPTRFQLFPAVSIPSLTLDNLLSNFSIIESKVDKLEAELLNESTKFLLLLITPLTLSFNLE